MAIGARTDNSTDMLKKLLGEISNIMVAPDADVEFLQQLHGGIIQKLRAPVDQGYAAGILGSGGPTPTDPSAMGAAGGMPAMIPGPSSATGASPLAALLGGGGPTAAGGLMTRPPQPSADELRRVLRKV